MSNSSNDFAPLGRRRPTTCRSPAMGGDSTARRLSLPSSPRWRRIVPPVATSSSMTTEPPPLDIDRILEVLDRHKVEFLLVGGVAALAYGARRPTSDLDCVTPRTEENLKRLAGALRALMLAYASTACRTRRPPHCRHSSTPRRWAEWRSRRGGPMPETWTFSRTSQAATVGASVMSTSLVTLTAVVSTASLSRSSRCPISSHPRSGRTDRRTTKHSRSCMRSPPRGPETTTLAPLRTR